MDLVSFAKANPSKTGYQAWREKSPENKEAWAEALEGYRNGLSPSVIARWLKDEKACPLTENTIRNQLKTEDE